MSSAEISAASPLPVLVTNAGSTEKLPSFFAVGSAWQIQGTSTQFKVTAVEGEWLQVETLTFVQTGIGSSQQFSGRPDGWIRPASFSSAVWVLVAA